jgi:hypothetical protein
MRRFEEREIPASARGKAKTTIELAPWPMQIGRGFYFCINFATFASEVIFAAKPDEWQRSNHWLLRNHLRTFTIMGQQPRASLSCFPEESEQSLIVSS